RLAARLAALAPPGATIVSAAARRLLRTAFDLAAEGVHAIDGAAPAEVFRLGDERREPDGATLEGARAPIAGREPELALLVERWRRACEGAGQSSLITGEAGIGKSRLARELRDRVAREPHSFLDLRCSPDTRNSALAAVVDLLERALGLDRERDARGRIARLEAELAHHGATPADAMPLFLPLFALPVESPYRPVEVSPQRQRALTLDAIVALLFAIAERAPVLLLAEDLHWADPTTIELVTRLVREAPDGPLCLVMTARPEFSPAFSTAGVLMLPLTRLGRPHTEQMVGALVRDKALPPAAVEHIANRADGVPLFVEELLHMMIDTGVLVERADRYELVGSLSDARIPGTLRALLTARLDRLSRARETAQLAAALGREFSVDVLTAASPEDPAVVAEDLERLVLAGLVLRKRRGKDAVCVFKHALLRDAAYDSLATGARHDTHARIAAVLEERFPEVARTRPDLLAHHHAAAEHMPRAVVYAQRAAEHGLQRSMYAEAIAHAENAIAWADALHGADGVEAELSANGALIQALMATRGWADPQVKAVADRSARLLDQLEPDSKHRVPTLWSLFTYHHVASHRGTARSVAEQLVAIAGRSGEAGFAAAAAMLHGLALFIDGDHAAARPVFERAVALYDPALHRDHGARFGLDSLVLARAFLAHLRWFAGAASDAFALVASAIAWAR
ncbi:MAG TPA: AAA family ATPase, partial [Kofleriaceae bacterium]